MTIRVFAQSNEIKIMYSPISLKRIDSWERDFDGLDAKYTGALMVEYNQYMASRWK